MKDKKHIFFRNDDVADLNENLIKLIDIFISHEVPIHLAVIPQKLTLECRDFLLKKIKDHGGTLLEIGQHGKNHTDYSRSQDNFGKYEFGENRSYKQQKEDIAKGRKILTDHFNKNIDIFTPPWHGFDENTLRILAEQNFETISAEREINLSYDYYGINNISIDIDYNKINTEGSWYAEDNAEIVKKLINSKKSNIGILLHHNAFKNPKDFTQLDKLLRFIKKDNLVNFILLSKVAKHNGGRTKINFDILAYYLNYQFVPKPLTLAKNSANPIYKIFNFNYHESPKPLKENFKETSKNLYIQLRNSIKNQLPSDNKAIGILLSGGLDSATILHTLRDLTDRKIYTITGSYTKESQALNSAKRLAKKYNTSHQSFILSPKSLLDIDELYRKNIPQPIGDNGFLSTYLLTKNLKEKTQYVFSGDGADCLFCGLNIHPQNLTEKMANTPYEHYRFGEIFLDEEELKMILGNKSQNIRLETPFKMIADKIAETEPIKRQVLLDLNFLAKNRVDYINYAAKVNNMNILLPYLNLEFIDFALRIPHKYLFSEKYQKKDILRQAFSNMLPKDILTQKKEGFTPPFKLWYYINKEFVAKNLIRTKKIGISTSYIKYLLNNIKISNNYDIGMKIWLLLNLSSWYSNQK